jgi:hypothetical protein
MERNQENQRPSGNRLRVVQILALLGLTASPATIAALDEPRQMAVRTEAQERLVEECRDKVTARCLLGKTRYIPDQNLEGTRKLKTTDTGKRVAVGNESARIRESENGYVVLDPATGEQYPMGKLTLAEIEDNLGAKVIERNKRK